MEKRDYLQISYAHDSRHFDFRSNCLLIMCSVYLNRGLPIYFIVFKGFRYKSRSHLSEIFGPPQKYETVNGTLKQNVLLKIDSNY